MREQGRTIPDIAEIVDTTKSIVKRTLARARAYGSPNYRQQNHCGRARKTTARQDRLIIQNVNRCRTLNATKNCRSFEAATDVRISTQTLRRRLHERGLKARRRAACPALQAAHRAARRQWAGDHANWGIAEWRRCMFTDECRFNLYESDGRVLVWRARNQRYVEENMDARVPFEGGGVLVWGGVMLNGRTDLVVLVRESMNGERYRDLCIRDIIIPFAQNFGNDFILVDDNARPHRARIVQDVLRDNNIERMNWPARSPDMNVIEHVWSWMKRKLNDREHNFNNLNELANAIRVEWNAIPQDFLANLVSSMPRRVAEVRRAHGGPTHY